MLTHTSSASCQRVFFLKNIKSCVTLIYLFGTILFSSSESSAQSAGFNTTYAVLSINGGSNAYYDLQATTGNPDFQGANLGNFNASNSLLLKGAEHNVYKCGGCDLTSSRVYYRVYLTSNSPGAFSNLNIGYSSGGANGCGGEDQQWANTGYSTNLLSGLTSGNYTVELYSDASVTCVGGTVFASNGGANYKATFNYCEPTISAGGPTTFCPSGSVVLTSSSATGNVWSPGGATTQSITATTSGNYTVTVTDGNGCVGTSAATTVTAADTENPTALCNGALSVTLDGTGNYTLTATQVNNGSSDNCSSGAGLTLSLDRTGFTCADVGLGAITVTLTVTDEAGNSSTCTSGVTVQSGGNCGPANDDCSDAISIEPSLFGYALWDTINVSGASQSALSCIGTADDDTWYKWIAQSSNDVVIVDGVGGTSNMVIEIFDACGGNSLGCFDNYGTGVLERAWAGNLTVNNTYYFRAYDSASGGPASGEIRVLVKTFAQGGIRDIYCGITNYQLSSYFTPERQDLNQLYPYTTVAAAGYEVKLTDQSTNNVYSKAKLGTGSQYFQFSNFIGIPYNSLFDAQARHAINVLANGTTMILWGEYGDACTMGLSGVTQSAVRPQYCSGLTDYGLEDQILAVYVPNASMYRFTFFDGVNTHVKTKNSYGLFLHDVPGLEYGKTYQTTVQAQVNGVWSNPGTVCSINMYSQPPSIEVRAQFCNGTYLFPQSNFILAEMVYGADQYQWRFTPSLGGTPLTDFTSGISLAFHLTDMALVSGSTYDVEVRASVQGIWGDYAASCPLTIQANPGMQGSGSVALTKTMSSLHQVRIFPNPSHGDDLMVAIDSPEALVSSVIIEVLDITGKSIHTQRTAVKGEAVQFKAALLRPLETGLYLVRITIGDKVYTERLLVNR